MKLKNSYSKRTRLFFRTAIIFGCFITFFCAFSSVAQDNKDKDWVSGGFFNKERISGDITKNNPHHNLQHEPDSTSLSDDSSQKKKASLNSSQVFNRSNPNDQTDKPDPARNRKIDDDTKTRRENQEARDNIESIPFIRDRFERDLELAKEQDRRARSGQSDSQLNSKEHTSSKRAELITRESQKSFFANSASSDPLDLPRAVVSLIVAALPENEYEKTLRELVDLHNNKNVIIGEVIVVGSSDRDIEQAKIMKEWAKAKSEEMELKSREVTPNASTDLALSLPDSAKESPLQKYKFAHYQNANMDGILSKFEIANSPSWIVNYDSINYVIEGPNSIWSLFTKAGEFSPAAEANRKLNGNNTDKKKLSPAELEKNIGQSYLATNEDPVIKLQSSANKNLFKIRSYSEKIYRYGPDLLN